MHKSKLPKLSPLEEVAENLPSVSIHLEEDWTKGKNRIQNELL